MAGFDTSGVVMWTPPGACVARYMRWTDLNPFTQGYVEAMFRSCLDDGGLLRIPFSSGSTFCSHYGITFSDLAPQTLARIMEDCEKLAAIIEAERLLIADRSLCEMGKWAWRGRQAGGFQDHGLFPVIIYLDEGKVYLRDAPSPSSDRGGS